MKVLLIQPPHRFNGDEWKPSAFPIGLGSIATVTCKADHDVEVLDVWANNYSDQQVLQFIPELDYDVVGISAFSTQYKYVKWLSSALKNAHGEGRIVLGGPLATYSSEIVLPNTQVDVCVVGEGEETFPDLLGHMDDLQSVKGIVFGEHGKLVKTEEREYIKDLDSISFPAWQLFPIEKYLSEVKICGTSLRAMNVVTSRGCPYRCRFCSKTFRHVRYRSVNNVMKEISELIRKFGIKGVAFHDELFLANKQRAFQFCDRLESLGLKWSCQGRANLVDYELLKRMKQAGCVEIGFGVESGSQKILDSMCKHIKVEQSERAVKDAVKAGVRPTVQMMYGYPGENLQTLNETVKLFERLPFVGEVQLAMTTPLPGSELYDESVQKGLINNEEEYLSRLEEGYINTRRTPAVNLTGFSLKEFSEFKSKAEELIWQVQKRKYGVRKLFSDVPRVMLNRKNWSVNTFMRYVRKWI